MEPRQNYYFIALTKQTDCVDPKLDSSSVQSDFDLYIVRKSHFLLKTTKKHIFTSQIIIILFSSFEYETTYLLCLPTYLHTYLPTYLLPTYLSNLPTYLFTYLPANLPTYLPLNLFTYQPTYLPTYLFTYLPT